MAEIYNWNPVHVLKLFTSWVTMESIENEARMARTIYKSGLPVPQVDELVRMGDRTGLICKRVHGNSMYKAAQRQPWNIIRYLRRSAGLHAEIHSRSIPAGLPSQ
jgi:aminoglycoside phosphotransferase